MAVLLVTYDLNKPGKDYNDLLKTIKSYAWARLSESSYAIKTDQSPQQVLTNSSRFLIKMTISTSSTSRNHMLALGQRM